MQAAAVDAAARIVDVARGAVGDFLAEELLDHVERHVDAGGDARRRDDAVVDPARAAHDGDAAAERFELVERRPVRGGALALRAGRPW